MNYNNNLIMSSSITYKEKHDKALSYLLTIGSKALILMDNHSNNNNDTEIVSSSSSFEEYKKRIKKGLDEESLIKSTMLKEEIIRMFRRLLQEHGVRVIKRGRNRKCHDTHIKLKIKKNNNDCIIWKSFLWGKKKFQLTELKSITLLDEGHNNRYIRIENNSRYLDIKFNNSNAEQEQGCLHWMQTYMSK